MGKDILKLAIETNNFALAKPFLGYIHYRDRKWDSVFIYCCEKGYEDLVDLSIQKQIADIDCFYGIDEHTTLSISCANGHTKVVDLLLRHGARIYDTPNPLLYACSNGHSEIAQLLLKRGANIDCCDVDGQTPLMGACTGGHADIVKLLIRNDANISVCDKNGLTAFVRACSSGHKDIVNLLLEHIDNGDWMQAFINIIDDSRLHSICALLTRYQIQTICDPRCLEQCLIYSCKTEDDNLFEELIRMDVGVNGRDSYLETALMLSCRRGDIKRVRQLIEKGADVNAKNKEGETALMISCWKGHKDLVYLLIERGADVNATDGYGDTALTFACEKGHEYIVHLLLEREDDVHVINSDIETVLMLSCKKGHENVVHLLRRREDVIIKAKRPHGESVLKPSREQEYQNIAQRLIRYKADDVALKMINCVDHDTQRHTAHFELVRSLIPAQMNYIFTPLIYVCDCHKNETSRVEVVKLLLSKGADSNVRNKTRRTALIKACSSGCDIEMINLLLERGAADANVQDETEETALMKACRRGCDKAVQYLVKKDAKLNIQNKEGHSAVMIAVSENNLTCLDLLLAADADVNLTNAAGDTVFTIAARRYRYDTLRILFENDKVTCNEFARHPKNSLLLCMQNGFFKWEWCLNMYDIKTILFSAFEQGFCPGKFRDWKGEISPLVYVCVNKFDTMARKFIDNLYFYPEDYTTLRTDESVRRQTNPIILDKVTVHPMTLKTWSLLTISKAISMSGPPTLRGERVDALPIPDTLRRGLKFECVFNGDENDDDDDVEDCNDAFRLGLDYESLDINDKFDDVTKYLDWLIE